MEKSGKRVGKLRADHDVLLTEFIPFKFEFARLRNSRAPLASLLSDRCRICKFANGGV